MTNDLHWLIFLDDLHWLIFLDEGIIGASRLPLRLPIGVTLLCIALYVIELQFWYIIYGGENTSTATAWLWTMHRYQWYYNIIFTFIVLHFIQLEEKAMAVRHHN